MRSVWRRQLPTASPDLLALLDGRGSVLQPPLRAEIFGPQRLAQHARSLGLAQHAAPVRWPRAAFFPRLRSNVGALRAAHRFIGRQAAAGHDISPAAEWLLDNFHLIEAQLAEIHAALPRRYYRALPMLQGEPLDGLPRIYGVAWAFVAHTDSAFDEDLLVHFLQAYQQTRELRLGEMWALPTTLRVVLIESLRRLAERLATHKAAREAANLVCDAIDQWPVETLQSLLLALERRGAGAVFLVQMAHRLQDGTSHNTSHNAGHDDGTEPPHAGMPGPDAVLAWLHTALPMPSAAQAQLQADQTADNLSVSNAVNSLRAIGDADWADIVGRSSALMQRLLCAPAFDAEHVLTRTQTLRGVERLARRSGRSELAVAQALLALMQQGTPGQPAAHWLAGPGRPALTLALGLDDRLAATARVLARQALLPAYLATLLLGTAGLVAWCQRSAGVGDWGWLGALLLVLPASEAVVAVLHRLIGESLPPGHLPRLALAGGIPAEHRVLVVVPALLTDADGVRALVHRLLLHHLANPERHAQFALLGDGADAATEHLPGDTALQSVALQALAALNAAHGNGDAQAPRFILLQRPRRYSSSEQRWIGWERKRGKLEALLQHLALGPTDAFLDFGAASTTAADTRYVVTLDADTQLPPGRLRELVGVAAHPCNTPRLDSAGRRVVAGHGILQPRVATPLAPRAQRTVFHWLFAGHSGIDPYSAASSEVYQDLFDQGSFSGKGLLHVQAMHRVLGGRLPDEQVLSHDLLEGALLRCAVVSDITLLEDAPFHADVAAARVHRWTRGDWQLIPLLLQPRRLAIGALNRWKMLDNLRRSLVAPASLLLLLLAFAGQVLAPAAALALVFAAFAAGPLLGALAGLAPARDDVAPRRFYPVALAELLRAAAGGLWQLVQLPAQSLRALDAIGRALWRQAVSRRLLLQWTSSAAVQAAAGSGWRVLLRRHRHETLLALLAWALLLLAGTPWPWAATALCAAWALAPLATAAASRPQGAAAALPAADRLALDAVARDTWRFFERCVGPADHHLPPDNLQILPHEMLARRTSPTNIGLYLLAAVCARRFGWIGTQDLLARLEATLATLQRLPRHRGHVLNWIDTETLAPLLPMYVSAVDSGNLSGHLLAVAAACRELARAPYDDALPQALAALQLRLAGSTGVDVRRWLHEDIAATEASAALDQDRPADAGTRLLALAALCEAQAWAPDFAFLYHRKRHLLHLGYRVAEQQLDAGFYDLLASESRLTSLLAIAKGDVPVRHWAALGRPFYGVGGRAGLRSWSGSMFEYLMPSLVLAEPPGSVLQGACAAALAEQQAFGAAQRLPWGVSESAYAAADHTLAYQYAPQGVPRLALRRTPIDALVVAPYATALAAPLSPHGAWRNFEALAALGARGRYGFIEALDFSPARQLAGDRVTPVATYMSHHQGMTIVALANVLLDGVAQRWGMADPHIEAVTSLLHEAAPREVPRLLMPVTGQQLPAEPGAAPALWHAVPPGDAAVPPTQLLGNGRYGVTLRPNGAGASRCGADGVTRERDDALRDAHGSFLFVRWDRHPALTSLTLHPAPDLEAHYGCSFHADRVVFDTAWPALQVQTTVWVSPEDDIEFREVCLSNLDGREIDIELISAIEPTLCPPRADEAHPAFTKLFLGTQWWPAQQALVFTRTPRLAGDAALQAAHFIAGSEGQVIDVALQTDRAAWLGRHRDASQPLAQLQPAPDGGETALATGLDPVGVLAVRLRLPRHGQARVTFATAASADAATLRAVVDKYRQPSHVQRASLMSATLAGIRLRALRLGAADQAALQVLSTALLQTLTRPLAPAAAACDRRTLWALGLSGDRPIVLVSAGNLQGLGLLRTLAQGLRQWAWAGVACDLVLVNTEAASYQMTLQQEMAMLRDRHAGEGGTTTALLALQRDAIAPETWRTLQQRACVRLVADGRPLAHHVQVWSELHDAALELRHATSTTALALRPVHDTPLLPAGGAFDSASGRYVFDCDATQAPPRPWINVLANPAFGALLSESGGGHTWALNSRMQQLTAWGNDPVADLPAEWWLLQDLRSREAWSVAPSAWADGSARYTVEHGQGGTRITHRRGDLAVEAAWCVDAGSAVKQLRLRVVNHGSRTQRLRVFGLVEWLLGATRSERATVQVQAHTQRLPGGRLLALLATQHEAAGGFGGGTAFLAVAGSDHEGGDGSGEDWTCDRRECFDARGRLVLPDHLGRHGGTGLDPCAALSLPLTLAAGAAGERVFLIGWAPTPEAARLLAASAAVVPAAARWSAVHADWDARLGTATVTTPDPLFDVLVNRWLLYQALSCRLWAKAGFYQAGGATGFRDQLQDTLALAWSAPELLRAQILLCASRQFAEGDVQHWWHAPGGAGVRTHFSDDLLWLAHACVHHQRCTADATLLDEQVPFLEGAAIPDGAEDVYDTPRVGSESASVYEHAARAIDRSLAMGAHNLPLMGSGDWNDGMNRVGHGGQGESVWLAWFLCRLVADFAPLARARGEAARAQRWQAAASRWRAALQGAAWDGAWFKRGFFDDGSALGANANAEARIDLIAQAWAVLADAVPRPLQERAMACAEALLADTDHGLLRLLDPPLVHAQPSAGYIQAYPPGVRENGGQYTHGAVWALLAQAELARRTPDDRAAQDRVYRDFTWLSPAHRAVHPVWGPAYGLEPYAVAGDVCSQPPYTGRGGWSWYTGAAAWMHRAAIEGVFGLRWTALDLVLRPCLPSHWPQATLVLQRDGRTMRFTLQRGTVPAPPGAHVLKPGEHLCWPGLRGDTHFVVPLP